MAGNARVTAVTLVTFSREYGEERLGIRLLDDMRTVFGEDEKLPTKVILEKLRGLDEAPWADIEGKPLNDRGLAAHLRSCIPLPRRKRGGQSAAAAPPAPWLTT